MFGLYIFGAIVTLFEYHNIIVFQVAKSLYGSLALRISYHYLVGSQFGLCVIYAGDRICGCFHNEVGIVGVEYLVYLSACGHTDGIGYIECAQYL